MLEYLKLLPKALKNPKEVLQGWINVVREELGTLPEETLQLIAARRVICNLCPFQSENAKKVADYVTTRIDEHCTLCSCPIKAKTASLDSKCGAQYYNETHPDLPNLEVRW